MPRPIKNLLRPLFYRMRWKGRNRIFCLSMQRTGTTSVGDFFQDFGFPTARWGHSIKNEWTKKWFDGDFEAIFSSADFWSNQVFEDDPWWLPEFYKVLYHRFPGAKFILLTRDSDSWFRSMIRHSKGKTLGNTQQHCKFYRREKEFFEKLDNDPSFQPTENEIDNLMELTDHADHYKEIYEIRNREIVDFFQTKAPNALLVCDLADPKKWIKIGEFIGFSVPENYKVHAHNSAGGANGTSEHPKTSKNK